MARWTQTDVDQLKSVIKSGVSSFGYGGPPGRTMTYQALKDLRSLLAEMEQSVAVAAGESIFALAEHDKGFE